MLFIGQIEAASESAKIDPNRWLALIDSHRSLMHRPRVSVMVINPFTREPCEYTAASASTADVLIGGAGVGSIWWALDGSPFLNVQAEEESAEAVAKIAEEVATALGARFVRE